MIAAALIFEASTPFVSLRAVLSQLDGMRHSRLYMFNGIAMVIVFFSCRILIYPIFYKCYGISNNYSFSNNDSLKVLLTTYFYIWIDSLKCNHSLQVYNETSVCSRQFWEHHGVVQSGWLDFFYRSFIGSKSCWLVL